jgi:1-acyl-sn-glycerol-3-phosphate acyltransferase
MGLHSALFGPVKYAYLPQKLAPDELVGGNGLVEMGTFVGILLGEILGAVLVSLQLWGIELVAGGTIVIALAGWLASRAIPYSPAPAPDLQINWNLATETARNIRFSWQNRPVFLSMLANSWFWFYGAIVLAQFPLYAKEVLHGDHGIFVLLLTIFSLGIGAGSLVCERLSGRKVEIGLVPLGAIGLSVFGFDLFLASLAYTNTNLVDIFGFLQQRGGIRILLDCLMIGVFGGLYIVPLFALIQTRCDPGHMSRTIAGMNILNALFMVVAALVAMVLLNMGLSIPQLFLVTAILNALVTACVFIVVPEFLIRFLAWLLIHTTYRVRCIDADRIPQEGGALLICNHVSDIDAIVILAASPRPLRLVMDHRILRAPVLSWLFKAAKVIPMAPAGEDARVKETGYAAIAQALAHGELVCIFREGKQAGGGESNAFNGGILRILEQLPVPVIPMTLRGLWGGLLTRSADNPFHRSFRIGPFSKLKLAVGEPMPATDVTSEVLRDQTQGLRGDRK